MASRVIRAYPGAQTSAAKHSDGALRPFTGPLHSSRNRRHPETLTSQPTVGARRGTTSTSLYTVATSFAAICLLSGAFSAANKLSGQSTYVSSGGQASRASTAADRCFPGVTWATQGARRLARTLTVARRGTINL